MTVIELLTAAAYGQPAFDLAQRVLATGFLACAPIWIWRTPGEQWPWQGPFGAIAHTGLALGALLWVWTVPL